MKRVGLIVTILSLISCQAQATSAAAIAGGVFGGLLLADIVSTKMSNDVGDNYLHDCTCQNCDSYCGLQHCGVYPAQAYYPYYYY